MAIQLTKLVDNQDKTVTVSASDGNKNYTSVIGLVSAPDPNNAGSAANIRYYKNYIQSTIPPAPQEISLG